MASGIGAHPAIGSSKIRTNLHRSDLLLAECDPLDAAQRWRLTAARQLVSSASPGMAMKRCLGMVSTPDHHRCETLTLLDCDANDPMQLWTPTQNTGFE